MNRLFMLSLSLIIVSNTAFAEIEKYFQRAAQYHHFNGVALINSDQNTQIFAHGNATHNKGITAQTRFNIGSLTKQFTAFAVLTLVESKQISLHAPINQYLGNYQDKKWQDVTIHHLLTHTSGIPSIYQTEQGLPIFFPEQRSVTLAELIARFKHADLLFDPGSDFSYSNSGYVLLAAIIEHVSKKNYFTFMHEEVFKLHGLNATSFERNENSATPYYGYHPALRKEAPRHHPTWSYGAGGVYSTVNDLSKWVDIILSKNALTGEQRDAFLNGHVPIGQGAKYGYGWVDRGNGILQHDGGDAGFISFLSLDKTTHQHHIILTNQSYEDITLFGNSGDLANLWSDAIWQWRKGNPLDVMSQPHSTLSEIVMSAFSETTMFSLQKQGEYWLLNSQSAPDLFGLITGTPMQLDSDRAAILTDIARKLKTESYWAMARHFDAEMKFVTYTGLLWLGLSEILAPVGENRQFVAYRLSDNRGFIRVRGDEGMLDIVAYFDDEDNVMGLFDTRVARVPQQVTLPVYQIDANTLYVDGFQVGQPPFLLHTEQDAKYIEQFGRRARID